MYEFEYEGFEFLRKFQLERDTKIFVIENEDNFEMYYTEHGLIFSAKLYKAYIFSFMKEEHNVETFDEALTAFKTIYLKNTTTPLSVKKDTREIDETQNKEPININIQIAQKMKSIEFELV